MEEISLRDMEVDGRDKFERHGRRWKRPVWETWMQMEEDTLVDLDTASWGDCRRDCGRSVRYSILCLGVLNTGPAYETSNSIILGNFFASWTTVRLSSKTWWNIAVELAALLLLIWEVLGSELRWRKILRICLCIKHQYTTSNYT
jgi:hypothetical protein